MREIMIRRFFERLKRMTRMPGPASYDPSLHYNCFIESVAAEDRQAVYKELCRMGKRRYLIICQMASFN